jgi:ribonuclease HI
MADTPLTSPIVLVTDGACSGNGTANARGGWAAILTDTTGRERVLTGAEVPSTNNRMELTAALEGLAAAPAGANIELVTDSTYLANAISQGWLDGWQRRGWRTAAKQPVANRELWERMIRELARHARVRTTLVRGHTGHDANERADRLAQQAALEDSPPQDTPAPQRPAGPRSAGDDAQLGFSFDP